MTKINVPLKNYSNLILIFFLTGFLSIFFGLFHVYLNPIFSFGLLGLFFIILASLKNIKILFYALFLWSITIGIVTNLTFLGQFNIINYGDEIFVFMLALILFFRFRKQELNSEILKFVLIIFLFISFVALSTILNKGSFIGLLNFLSTYLKFFIIFICAVSFLEFKDMKKLIFFMLLIGVFQFFVVNVQFFSYGKTNILVGPEINLWQDSACGLFGEYGAHRIGHFSIIFLILSTSLWLFTFKKKWLFFIFICLYTFIISFTEQDYLFLIFFILISVNVFLRNRIKMPFKSFAFCGIFLLIFSGIFMSYKTNFEPTKRYFAYFSNPRKIEGSGKVQSLLLVQKIISQEPHYILIGVGPGSFSGGIAAKVKGKYYKKYIEYKVRRIKSTLDYWWSSFITLISETGLVGYLLYVIMFILIFVRGFKMYKCKNIKISNFDKGMAFALCNIIGFLWFISFLSNALEWVVLTFPCAIISAYVWKSYNYYYKV